MMFPVDLRTSEVLSCLATASALAGAPGSDESSLAGPQIDLGPGLEVTRLTPGRFANVIQKNKKARHALQVIREETTSSFVLDLKPDGSATVCRGWRYLFFNDGPQVHTSEHIREQLGYRGRWDRHGWWVHIDLALDDAVCPRVGQYSQLVPNHAHEWHLRGLPIEPRDHSVLPMPGLACQSTNADPVFGEDEPHVVAGILPGRWLVLGAGNGLRIKLEANSVNGGEPPAIRVEVSPDLVPINAWEQSF